MRIALGANHAGLHVKDSLKRTLDELSVTYQDFGTASAESVDYPDVAHAVAGGQFDRGILVCEGRAGDRQGVHRNPFRRRTARYSSAEDPRD